MSRSSSVDFAKALADETRQKIMRLCCCEWVNVSDMVAKLDVSQPTVSHHLAILREAGLVSVREEGRQTFYTLNQDMVVDCCGLLMTSFAPEQKATQQLIKLTDIKG